MKKSLLIFVFVSLLSTSYSQVLYKLEASYGGGFNNKMHINQQELEETYTSSLSLGVGVIIPIGEYYNAEIGLFFKYLYSEGELAEAYYYIHSTKGYIPFYLERDITEKMSLSLGVLLINNKDLEIIDFRTEKNLRFDGSIKFHYRYSSKWYFNCAYNKNINNVPVVSFISYPKYEITIGASYILNKIK